MSELSAELTWVLKRGSLVYPQPVAISCGRIRRASTPQEVIDASLKAAEVLCRYLAAVGLASLAAREGDEFPTTIKPFERDLAFGHFLSLVQLLSKVPGHPLASYFGGFRPRGKGKGAGPADAALTALLELRNSEDHGLTPAQSARAQSILDREQPETRLCEAYEALEPVLRLPLMVFDNVRLRKRVRVAQRLLFMGEIQDPVPDTVEVTNDVDDRTPYVAVNDQLLAIDPVVVFELINEQSANRLAMLDGVGAAELRYKTLDSQVIKRNGERAQRLTSLFSAARYESDHVRLLDGRTLEEEWRSKRDALIEGGRLAEGPIPWDSLDNETLAWFAEKVTGAGAEDPRGAVITILLAGRDRGLTAAEIRELQVLFGTEAAVAGVLRRDLYDFRARGNEVDERWTDRVSGTSNVFDALRTGVEFLARHVDLGMDELRDLTRTTGSPDYVAMREALVNQFIHQDYGDPSAACQVELSANRAEFFNTGHSLLSDEQLMDGGKSQARNPLTARALRLVGFAEMAGSGLRAVQNEWRRARRRPPVVDSKEKANTFTLVLDWREVPDAYDAVWRGRLGVEVTAAQAAILNLAAAADQVTDLDAASAAGLTVAEAQRALSELQKQVLLQRKGKGFELAQHLKELLK